jgi:quercetin dioxygenase-like cupin family protein
MLKKKKSKALAAKKSATKKSTAKKTADSSTPAPGPQFQHIAWHTIPLEELNPLLQRQFVVGQEIMAARILLKKGCIVPEHSHHNEQLSYTLDGAVKFFIAGREVTVRAGEVICIPAHMPHKAEALEDSVSLDVFTPPRVDWINRTDQYLREQ